MLDLELELNKMRRVLIGFSLLILAALFLWAPVFLNPVDVRERMLAYHVSGIVREKFMDKRNHNEPTLVLSDGSKVYLSNFAYKPERDKIFDAVEIGDSVYKARKSDSLFLFRGGQKIGFLSNQ